MGSLDVKTQDGDAFESGRAIRILNLKPIFPDVANRS